MEETKVTETGVETGAEGKPTETVKTYTQEEVLALIQSESDKRVTQALATQKKKYEQEISLSKLDDNERAKAEKDAKIEELNGIIAQMNLEKNKSELKSVLSSRGLSAEFADILVITDDLATSQGNIDKLDKLFKAAVTAEVEKRLASGGGTPKGNGAKGAEITKETAKRMSMAELNKLATENPELFNSLFN